MLQAVHFAKEYVQAKVSLIGGFDMQYDFDTCIPRKNTHSVKYDFASQYGKPENTIPLWIADMDFKVPPCVFSALENHVHHGIFGYSDTDDKYFDVLQSWFSRRFNWQVQPDWLVKVLGVVTLIHISIRALTKPGDAVIIQQPVYPPFSSAVNSTNRKLVVNELLYTNNYYTIDFEDFEKKIVDNHVKLFILCSPHNPVGRVWKKEELLKLGDICLRHGVKVISDELHADIVYLGHKHHVFANLSPELSDISITCTAPSKTFNLAGLQLSNNFISNPHIRKAIIKEYYASGLSQLNVMGIVAAEAAYRDGEAWLEELKSYLHCNVNYLKDFLARKLPSIKLVEPEGTYLMWLDFRELGFSPLELEKFMLEKAELWLNDGPSFGAGGEGFQRMNIACPRATLEKALERLAQAM